MTSLGDHKLSLGEELESFMQKVDVSLEKSLIYIMLSFLLILKGWSKLVRYVCWEVEPRGQLI